MEYAQLEQLCSSVRDVVKQVGLDIAISRKRIDEIVIEKKGVRDFVTEVDRHAEQALVKQLQNLLPEAGFVTEEKTIAQSDKPYNWIIDPLDGTMNFVHGIPAYSVSIGLEFQHEIKIKKV